MQLYRVEKKKSSFWKYVFVILITVIATLFADRTIQKANEMDEFAERLSLKEDTNNVLNLEENQPIQTENYIENVLKSTVGISLLKPDYTSIFDVDLEEKWGIGTGIIVSENGYVLTNQHLAKNRGARLVVTLNSGKSVQGRVIWTEENIDLAIIKIDSKEDIIAAKIGDSESLKIGNEVMAIGNPLGIEFQGTTTKGIVSGLDRTIMFEEDGEKIFMEGLIQTDASINPGNSGGPLINSSGEVIGINTVKITSAEGIGFAVPINIVKNVIESYERNGVFAEAYLGIYAYDSEVIPYLESNNNFENGIYVVSIDKKGPCGNIDLEKGDIITQIDDVKINKMTELREYLYSKRPGDKVILNVEDGENKILEVVLRKEIE